LELGEKYGINLSMKLIESRQNPIIKLVRSLGEKKARKREGLFLLEGLRMMETVKERQFPLKYLLVGDNFFHSHLVQSLSPLAQEVYQLPQEILEQLSGVQQSQGILGVAEIPQPLNPETIKPRGIYLLLEKISDPGNLGTIIRLCWGGGVSGLFLAGDCADLYEPKTVRSTAGGIIKLPVYHFIGACEALDFFQKKLIKPYLTVCQGAKPYYKTRFKTPMVLCFGSEAHGLSPEFLARGLESVGIPLEPGVDSLNLAMSCGILLYGAKYPNC